MSPILLRPIREQFEHNRVIRLLQTRLRRRYLVGINIDGELESTAARSGSALVYPDLVLVNISGARRVHGVVEVETAESVNHLEAMAEWVHFAKVRGAFYLYVPGGATDIARGLCEAHKIAVTEIWSYHAIGSQMRFTMACRSRRSASRSAVAARLQAKSATKAAGPAKQRRARPVKPTTGSALKKKARKGAQPARAKTPVTPAKRAAKAVRRAATPAKRVATAAKRTSKSSKPVAKTSGRTRKTVAKKAAATRARATGKGGKTATTRTRNTATPRLGRKHR